MEATSGLGGESACRPRSGGGSGGGAEAARRGGPSCPAESQPPGTSAWPLQCGEPLRAGAGRHTPEVPSRAAPRRGQAGGTDGEPRRAQDPHAWRCCFPSHRASGPHAQPYPFPSLLCSARNRTPTPSFYNDCFRGRGLEMGLGCQLWTFFFLFWRSFLRFKRFGIFRVYSGPKLSGICKK